MSALAWPRRRRRMRHEAVTLGDKYDLAKSRILLTGTQAVVRLVLMQQARDRRMGKRTAGYVTGYRGSPLGGLDQQFERAADAPRSRPTSCSSRRSTRISRRRRCGARSRRRCAARGASTASSASGTARDRASTGPETRCKHANLAGTSPWGGVVALMGDDHTCESSTTAHQSEYAFVDAMIPILSPAGVQEIIDYGLIGFALSRFAGTWVGLKCVKDTVESTATIDGSLDRHGERHPRRVPDAAGRPQHPPERPSARAGGAAARAEDPGGAGLPPGQRPRPAGARRRPRAADRHHHGGQELSRRPPGARRTRHRRGRAAELGIKLLKLACTWPIEPGTIRHFAERLEKIIVVEEKRGLIEGQVKEILYGTREPAGDRRQARRGRRMAAAVEGRARHQPDRHRHRRAGASRSRRDRGPRRAGRRAEAGRGGAGRGTRHRQPRLLFLPGLPATTARPSCRRARAPMPASAATTWSSAWTGRPRATPRWAPRAPTGWARRRSRRAAMSSRTSATAPTTTPAASPSAPRRSAGVNITYKHLLQRRGGADRRPEGRRRHDRRPDRAAGVGRGRERVVVVSEEPERYPRTTSGRSARPSTTATNSTRCRRNSRASAACRC